MGRGGGSSSGGGDKRGESRGKRRKDSDEWLKKQKKKFCVFCKDRTTIDWKDTMALRRFVSDRGKIKARRTTGTCSQHQRDVASAVKSAREMALLPFSVR